MKRICFAGLVVLITAGLAFAQGTTSAQGTSGADNSKAVPENTGKTASDAANAAAKDGAHTGTPASVPAPAAVEPSATGEPHTEMLDTANATSGRDPLLEPRPLPRADLSLIGGIARKVDSVRNRITVEPFGGGNKYVIYFDERTRILNNGRETTILAVRPGSRVYVDTQALGAQVFAKSIQVRGASGGPAQASGQVIEYLGGQVRMQDRLSGDMIRFVVTDHTKVQSLKGESAGADLHSGSLIDVTFTPGGKRNEAQSITIHATPGASYVFAGTLTNIDIRDGILALDNQEDGENYELYFDPLVEKNAGRLTVGTPVSITATFDGRRYRANAIRVTEGAASLEGAAK